MITQASRYALLLKNRANIQRQQAEIASALIAINNSQKIPPPPDGWSEARWRATIKHFLGEVKYGDISRVVPQ